MTTTARPDSRRLIDSLVAAWVASLGVTAVRAKGNPRSADVVSVYVEVSSLDDRATVAAACRTACADSVREHDADEDGPAYVGATFSAASLGRAIGRLAGEVLA